MHYRVASLPLIASIAGTVGALAGPAAPIVLPIAASLVLAKWVYDVYQQSCVAFLSLQAFSRYLFQGAWCNSDS
jgi:hypothetical protein